MGGVFTIASAVVAGVFAIVAAFIPVIWNDGKDDGQSSSSVSTPPVASTLAPEQSSAAPSASQPSQAPEKKYTVAYQDRRVSVSLPNGYGISTLDLDLPPTVKNYSDEDDYFAEREDVQKSGESGMPDLLYSEPVGGRLGVEEGRQAAQLDAPLPTSAEECASEAATGGFDSLSMETWPLEVGSGFCLITDQGNVARVVIDRFVGGTRSRYRATGDAPERIEFTATMWRAS
ncbi:hypothetical protein NHG22_07350 [Streptomyces sp. ATE26]|uniref:hypothetical protein n=1 Tax=Streptomyces sp. ATE26 TaxID=2954237 RepID=UPI0024824DED|nr:hypothetical protein [Streptomyces sp. ATE26]MDI1453631.1 hypothetical protein [Streptomyces sp. ATE26]